MSTIYLTLVVKQNVIICSSEYFCKGQLIFLAKLYHHITFIWMTQTGYKRLGKKTLFLPPLLSPLVGLETQNLW